MLRHAPRPELDQPSDGRRRELTLPGSVAVAPHQPRIAMPSGAEELQGRLAAATDENRNLTAQARELEAELRRSSAKLAELRGQLRGAVRDGRH
jgi:hypothetical protein